MDDDGRLRVVSASKLEDYLPDPSDDEDDLPDPSDDEAEEAAEAALQEQDDEEFAARAREEDARMREFDEEVTAAECGLCVCVAVSYTHLTLPTICSV
eukprot:3921925-Prymnesium_polylepis.1